MLILFTTMFVEVRNAEELGNSVYPIRLQFLLKAKSTTWNNLKITPGTPRI